MIFFNTSKLVFLVGILIGMFSCKKQTLFEKLSSEKTGINFKNQLTESEKYNILAYEYFYNGGGLAAADFNNDGLTDLYFAGNQVENKLYLNKSNLKFEEVDARVGGKNSWKTGITLVDINNDGFTDIYQCYSGLEKDKKNQLFVNQGLNKDGTWSQRFIEQAEQYGIADAGYTTQACFLDFDKDGDQDLFVLNHNLKDYQRKEAAIMKAAIDSLAGDRFYINVNGKFKDITTNIGIKSNPLGFGLGVIAADINNDHFVDLFVANDYVEEDYLYLNQKDGTFKEVGKEAMGHFSYSSMGVDAADINNDGSVDIFTADMLPEDAKRQKLLAFPDNWNVQESMLENGFHWQNMRNMLHLNLGNQGNGIPKFAEIGQLSGVSATDWSWGPVFADFDLDGHKDLFVSNGFVKDLTDLDFVKYFSDQENKKKRGQPSETLLEMVKKMPETPTHHYIFKNAGNLDFINATETWGLDGHAIASGSLAVDLDNDGDLELVTNNTNSTAQIYKNNADHKDFIEIPFHKSIEKVVFTENSTSQTFLNMITKGFQSASMLPFKIPIVNQAAIKIYLHSGETLNGNVKKGRVDISSLDTMAVNLVKPLQETLTKELDFKHAENDFNDFSRQSLVPWMLSTPGPRLSSADINADNHDDLFVCGASGQENGLFIQTASGTFNKVSFHKKPNINAEAQDACFFDADADGDQDLYIANGGYEQPIEGPESIDEFYLNNGKGLFIKSTLPENKTNKTRVFAHDIDHDKDLDVVLLGHIRAGVYPYSDPTVILKNNGSGSFVISQTEDWGHLTDATWYDLDADGTEEMIAVGHFSSIKIFKYSDHKYGMHKEIPETMGFWNCITPLGSGKFALGNLGLNTSLKASPSRPLTIKYGDTDGTGLVKFTIGQFWDDKQYPIYGRDEQLEQSPQLKKIFTDYVSYARALYAQIFEGAKLETKSVNELHSGILTLKNNQSTFEPFPLISQSSCIKTIIKTKINRQSGLLCFGNNSTNRIRIGKTDSNFGQFMIEQKNGTFKHQNIPLWIDGDVRQAIKINNQIVLGINNRTLKTITPQ